MDLLGRLQPTGLMVPDRNPKFFGNRCHSVKYDSTTCPPQRVSEAPAEPLAARRAGVIPFHHAGTMLA
jgi:hypothetical protein